MRNCILLLLTGACLALTAGAQSAPPAVATVGIVGDDKSVLTIQNNASVALTAYYWEVKNPGPERLSGESYYNDAAVIGASRSVPIPPHQQTAPTNFPVVTMHLTAFAAIWADGSSFGDPGLVARIRDRNRVYRQHLTTAGELVRQSLASGAPIDATIEAVQAAKESISVEHREDLHTVNELYDAVLNGLRTLTDNPHSRVLRVLTDLEQRALRYP